MNFIQPLSGQGGWLLPGAPWLGVGVIGDIRLWALWCALLCECLALYQLVRILVEHYGERKKRHSESDDGPSQTNQSPRLPLHLGGRFRLLLRDKSQKLSHARRLLGSNRAGAGILGNRCNSVRNLRGSHKRTQTPNDRAQQRTPGEAAAGRKDNQ